MDDFDVSPTALEARLTSAGEPVAAAEAATLERFIELVQHWNRVYNLTGTGGYGELVDRHLVESLALRRWLRGTRIADIGSGAGLPGIPLAICTSGTAFTLIESRAKRVHFLRHASATLALRNVTVAHCRAEDLPASEPFDTVLARAVARPAALAALARPLLRDRGAIVLLTSHRLAATLDNIGGFSVHVESPARLRSAVVVLERN
jgi:16S rRNA (guanine527-N7)-methyltransferase